MSKSRSKTYIDPRFDTPEFRKMLRAREPDINIAGRAPRQPKAIMLTHGEGYSTLAGKAVTTKAALTFQQDLFVTPAEDGLFSGHSQTWRNEQ